MMRGNPLNFPGDQYIVPHGVSLEAGLRSKPSIAGILLPRSATLSISLFLIIFYSTRGIACKSVFSSKISVDMDTNDDDAEAQPRQRRDKYISKAWYSPDLYHGSLQ